MSFAKRTAGFWMVMLGCVTGLVYCAQQTTGGLGLDSPAVAQEAKAGGAKAPAKEKAKGRLPAFFKDVVTDEQREKIYALQAKYDQQTDDLAAQIKAIQKKELEEIEAMLTADQKEKLARVRGEADAKKKAKSDAKKPAEPEATTAKPDAKPETKTEAKAGTTK